MGAGVACILALILKGTLKEARDVRFVGFEPPGGLLCKRISLETQRLGWFAVVCAHDWVPRIGIRNLQKLKVLALQELDNCNRSKLQLAFLLGSGIVKMMYPLCCFRRPLAAILRCLGGGVLKHSGEVANSNDEEEVSAMLANNKLGDLKFSSEITFPDLWPPGDIIYFRPVESIYRCGYFMQQDTEWAAEWADPQDLNEMVLTVRAIDLHVPWIYEDAIENVASAFDEEVNSNQKAAAARENRQSISPVGRSLRGEGLV